MKRLLVVTLLASSFFWCKPAYANDIEAVKQTELLEKINQLEQQIRELTELKLKNQTLPAKMEQCMKVVGVESYCNCIVEKLPVAVDYKQFVQIMLSPAAELGYAQMDQGQQQDIDNTLVALAKCVDYKGPKGAGFIEGLMQRDTLF